MNCNHDYLLTKIASRLSESTAQLGRIANALEAAAPEKQIAATMKLLPEVLPQLMRDMKAAMSVAESMGTLPYGTVPKKAPKKYNKGLSPTMCRECGKRIKKGEGFCEKCKQEAHRYMAARRANGDQ